MDGAFQYESGHDGPRRTKMNRSTYLYSSLPFLHAVFYLWDGASTDHYLAAHYVVSKDKIRRNQLKYKIDGLVPTA